CGVRQGLAGPRDPGLGAGAPRLQAVASASDRVCVGPGGSLDPDAATPRRRHGRQRAMSIDPELPLSRHPDSSMDPLAIDPVENREHWPALRNAVTRGSLWTLGGHGAGQALRLLNNLIVTRLLFPEAFGVMAIVDSLLIGLQMVSDTGVGPALIHRRETPDQ